LRVWLDNNGKWRATLETDDHHEEPELNISSMIAVVESFPDHLRAVWFDCSCREFNIGYECGVKPWGFDQTLSDSLLGRMAAVGASLRITLYPPECEASAENRPTPDRRRS